MRKRRRNQSSLLKKVILYGCTAMLAAGVLFASSPSLRKLTLNICKSIASTIAGNKFTDRLSGKAFSKSNYDGIDVSKHQGAIDWQRVAEDSKIQFVYIRATMGKGYPDKRYDRNMRGAHKAGIKAGSYHFLTSKYSIDEQYRSFSKTLDRHKQDLIPMIDVEEGYLGRWNRSQLQDSLTKFSELIIKKYGRKPMIYSSFSFYNKMLAPRFNNHILYIACYNKFEPYVKGKYDHNLWQYSDKGHIRGIGEYVDLCRFTNGTTIDDIILPDK